MQAKERLPILAAIKGAVDDAYKQAKADVGIDLDVGDRKALYIGADKVGSASVAEGKTSIAVYDPEALIEWCREREIPFTVSIPSSYYGKGGFLQPDGDVLVDGDGEVVPGVEVRKGEPYLLVRDCKPEKVIPLLTEGQFMEAISTERRLHE